jgi:hypothetical protein
VSAPPWVIEIDRREAVLLIAAIKEVVNGNGIKRTVTVEPSTVHDLLKLRDKIEEAAAR